MNNLSIRFLNAHFNKIYSPIDFIKGINETKTQERLITCTEKYLNLPKLGNKSLVWKSYTL